MCEVQDFPLDEYRANEGVAWLEFAVSRFSDGKHVKSVIADAHASVRTPLQSDYISGLQGACTKDFAVNVVAADAFVGCDAAKDIPTDEAYIIGQDVECAAEWFHRIFLSVVSPESFQRAGAD